MGGMKRRAVAGLVLGLLGAPAGVSALAAAHGVAVHRQEARSDAATQLAEVSLPPGARPVSRDPSASWSLGKLPWFPTGNRYVLAPSLVVDNHRFWRVSESPPSVAAWVKAHAPSQSTGNWTSGGSGSSSFTIAFRFPSDRGVVERALVLEVTSARGGGSAVRADGVAEWLPVHPTWDRVPGRARVLTERLTFMFTHGRPERATVTAAQKVRRIARLINRAGAIPPRVPPPCPAATERFQLSFRARPGGPVLARATGSPTGCAWIELTIAGRKGPILFPPLSLLHILAQIAHQDHTSHS